MLPYLIIAVVVIAAVLYAVWMAGQLGLGPVSRRRAKKRREIVESEDAGSRVAPDVSRR